MAEQNTTKGVMQFFEKEYGPGVLKKTRYMGARLPFGIFALDVALGGGIPYGKITMLYGPHSSGKTNHAMCLIREFQKRHPDQFVVYMDIEDEMDAAWMEKFGIDTERVYLLQPDTAEQSVDMSAKLLMAEDLGLLVFDSIAMLMAAAEAERSAEVANVGGAAIAIGKLVRWTNKALQAAQKKGTTPTVVWINQTRETIGHFSTEILPGGKSPWYIASTVIRFSAKQTKDSAIHPAMPAFMDTTALIKKAKFAHTSVEAKYKMALIEHGGILTGRTQDFASVKRYAQELGILVPGAKGKGWVFAGDVYPTLTECWEVLRSDPQAIDRFKAAVVESLIPKVQFSKQKIKLKANTADTHKSKHSKVLKLGKKKAAKK